MAEEQPLKMYILMRDSVDLGHAILGAAHASLGGYLTFTSLGFIQACKESSFEDPHKTFNDTLDWSKESFRKVVCKVTDKEFDKAVEVAHEHKLAYRAMQESALGDGDISLVFAPRRDWPKFFKFLKLYR